MSCQSVEARSPGGRTRCTSLRSMEELRAELRREKTRVALLEVQIWCVFVGEEERSHHRNSRNNNTQ